MAHPKKRIKSIQIREEKRPKSVSVPLPGCIRFSFKYFDGDFAFCKSQDESGAFCESGFFREIAKKLKNYESMKWNEIHARDHLVYLNHPKFEREAKQRLIAIRQDDRDGLWRFGLTGKERVWGIRDDDMFFALWWDPCHKICPSDPD